MSWIPWFKVDDSFHASRRWLSIPKRHRLSAAGLWVVAGSWCIAHATNGIVPRELIRHFGGTSRMVAELVRAELWRPVDSGFAFVEWRKHQDGDYRRNIRVSVRAAVMERDGERCVLCGSSDNLSLDHIVRYRDGGPDTVENLRVLCMPCNLERG